jgi:nitroreductase
MAASPALPKLKVVPAAKKPGDDRQPYPPEAQQSAVVHTTVHAMPTGLAVRSVRRRTTPEAGFALEILGHAIEYLADEYAHESGSISSIHSRDPRVEAMQLLMAANRQVYYACPVMPLLYQRIVGRLFGG